MNCIDAIEGSTKSIIGKLHQVFVEDRLDDAEYIRNVKAVLRGTNEFVENNKELLIDPKILRQVLYAFSKELWLSTLKKRLREESDSEGKEWDGNENDEYYEYYFDYIYAHSIYPK